MVNIDGGDAESTYNGLTYPATAEWVPPSDVAEELVDQATMLAWLTLQVLSAYQIALAPLEVRPSRTVDVGSYREAPRWQADGPSWPMMMPGGGIVNVLLGCRLPHDHSREVRLPGPVGQVDNVTIDGVTLTPSAYRIDDGDILVRQDGDGWPWEQDFRKPAGDDGTWSVTYWRGAVPDSAVNFAAGRLAQQWLLAIQGDDACQLPAGTQTVIRQGVTYDINPNWFQGGSTGLRDVDLIIARYNPYGLRTPTAIFSLDQADVRTTTLGL